MELTRRSLLKATGGSAAVMGPGPLYGSTSVRRPVPPAARAAGNLIQTDPAKGWFTILRLYSPLQPSFDKTWRPGEIELVA